MALFQKIPQTGSNLPLYTLGLSKNILIIGLGNPGPQYNETRHNIGFEVVDYFGEKNGFEKWHTKKDLKSELNIKTIGDARIILCKPATFMNNSGEAVAAVQHFYRIYNQHTLVVYDELAIGFGQLRSRVGGSDAGHNGVKSLIQHLGEDFNRLRIGVGNEISEKADAADFVLGKFIKKEREAIPLILREANELINQFILDGKLPHETRSVI